MSGTTTEPVTTETAAGGDTVDPKATILGATETGAEPKTTAPATWPDDWRQKLGGEDEKTLKRLARFDSPGAVWKSYQALEQKLSSGEVKRAAPAADAKPEEVAAWRKENGIPETVDGYLEKLPNGLVIGEADKELVKVFMADMHGQNAAPAVVHAALQSYYKVQEVVQAEQAEADAAANKAGEDELRVAWGGDYRRNLNAVVGWIKTSFGDAADQVMAARLPDGTPLASNPAIIRGMLATAMDVNPAATVVPGAGASAGKGIEERIDEINTMMRTNRREYDRSEKIQAEYRQLIDARERQKSRAA